VVRIFSGITPITREKLIERLQTLSAPSFLEEYVFDSVPHVFDGDRTSYVAWKRALGAAIDVDPACLTVVGSAAVGCSLNPSKNLKPFDDGSDVDVAVISNYHFTVGWRYLRMNGTRRLSVDQKTRIAWDEHVNRYIYWGTIATDKLLGVLPFGMPWLKATSAMALVEPTKGRDINLRIYADYEALRAYQTRFGEEHAGFTVQLKLMQRYLNTTHRTAVWFKKTFDAGDLIIKPPFQRNPVWSTRQKSSLIDTILLEYPIPELYMQEVTDPDGNQKHILVDGQ
jgi:hypothetical protein